MVSGPSAELVHVASAHGFGETVARLKAAITAGGLTLLAEIDHAAGARDVGLSMPPTLVLLYGNPRGGTPIMVAHPDAALELPLRVLVREETPGAAMVVFRRIAGALGPAGVPEDLARRLSPAQEILTRALEG